MKHIASARGAHMDSIGFTIARYSVYTLCVLIAAVSLPMLAEYRDAALFKEGGAIEWMQLGILLSVSLIFLREAVDLEKYRVVFAVLASLSAFAAIRELDAYLDLHIPWLGWKIGYIVILFAGFYSYINRTRFRAQFVCCLNSRAFSLLWAGFIVAIPFAQLVGNTTFMNVVMGADYNRDYQRMIEEIGELMGYSLLLLGSIELALQKRVIAKWEGKVGNEHVNSFVEQGVT